MRLSRTAPAAGDAGGARRPASGPRGPTTTRDGYTGTFDTQAFEPGGYGRVDGRSDTGPNRVRDTAAFERPDGFPGQDDDRFGPEGGDDRGRRGGSHRARHGRYDDDNDDYGRPGKRRWPIVTGALVLLVMLRRRRRVRVLAVQPEPVLRRRDQNGNVAIFQGTNQSLAGINLSSLYSESTLKASMLTTSDQAALTQTISQSSADAAHQKINQLAGEAKQCQQTYQELAAWKTNNVAYQAYLTAKQAAAEHHAHPPTAVANPGPMPTQLPDGDTCAPSTVFGVAGGGAARSGAATSTATPTATATPTKPASTPSKTATAKATSTKPATAG